MYAKMAQWHACYCCLPFHACPRFMERDRERKREREREVLVVMVVLGMNPAVKFSLTLAKHSLQNPSSMDTAACVHACSPVCVKSPWCVQLPVQIALPM